MFSFNFCANHAWKKEKIATLELAPFHLEVNETENNYIYHMARTALRAWSNKTIGESHVMRAGRADVSGPEKPVRPSGCWSEIPKDL